MEEVKEIFADTTLLIDFLRGNKKAIEKVRKKQRIYSSEINVYELLTGAYKTKKEQMHKKNVINLLQAITVFPFDNKAADTAAKITATLEKQGEKIEDTDAMIAGVALANNITTICTENKKHFQRIPNLKVETYS